MGQHPINLAVRFFLELAALFSVGYWGWTQHEGLLRYLLAIGLPLVAAVAWATFRVANEPHSGDPIIAVPGLVEGTICRWAPNLRWLDDVDFAALFPDVLVAAGNDAQFSLLAEAAAGAALGADNAILLAIGTSIGSALLADGRIVRGAGDTAVSFS